MANGDRVFAGENLEAAENYFKCKLPGFLDFCQLATTTVEPWIARMAKGTKADLKFQTAFAAGFICGSLSKQRKQGKAREWLEKRFALKKA